ncbi:MAG: RraA family protein [Pseudomonadota bacterium]
MNRSQTMSAKIKPLAPGMRIVGQARTIACMVGDNGAIHAAMRVAGSGDVLIIDAGGYPDTAVFGGLLTEAARAAGVTGVVIDGAVRDREEIVALGYPVFAAAVVPAGPHKGFGGTIDGVIACAGCPVAPGDIVLGDDDGVAVIPFGEQAAILDAALAKIEKEAADLQALKDGQSLADRHGIPEPTVLP